MATPGRQKKEKAMHKHFEVYDGGSVVLVTPLTKTAIKWVEDNAAIESWQWLGGAFSIEPRMVEDLLEGFASR